MWWKVLLVTQIAWSNSEFLGRKVAIFNAEDGNAITGISALIFDASAYHELFEQHCFVISVKKALRCREPEGFFYR